MRQRSHPFQLRFGGIGRCRARPWSFGHSMKTDQPKLALKRPAPGESSPPKPAVVAFLVILIVELPAFIIFLLIRWTPNYGPEWHNWPVLAGLFPAFFATNTLKLLPHHLSQPWLRFELA